MSFRNFVNKIKNSNVKKEEKQSLNEPFVFKYSSLCPALSIILIDKNIDIDKKYDWILELCDLFNMSMNTKIYQINPDDLYTPNEWFNKIFSNNLWVYSEISSKNPKIWGPYVWALLHIISLFWTNRSNDSVVYLIKNIANILPCVECRKHYSELISKFNNELYNLNSINSAVNFVINIREIIGENKKYNRVPEGDYSFIDIYNYIHPLVEPDENNNNLTLKLNSKCNCKKK